MIKFLVKVKNQLGKKIKAKIECEDLDELHLILENHNYNLLSYKIIKKEYAFLQIESITKKDVLRFTENISMMLKAGMSLSEAIKLCSYSNTKKKFAEILLDISKELEKGKKLYLILNKYPKVFPKFYRTMIRVADISGDIKFIIQYLINYYSFQIATKRKVINSLFYPSILLLFCFMVIHIIRTIIVPTFVGIFIKMKVELPLITKIIIGITNFLNKYSLLLLVINILLIIGLIIYFNSRSGKKAFDKLIFKLPLIKKFVKINFLIKFSKTLEVLIKSGIGILPSLETTANILENNYVLEKFTFALDEVKRGSYISPALYSTNLFNDLYLETISVSEKTGNMEYSLKILANIYEEEFQNKIKRLTQIIEPIFILIIALIIVLLIISIFIPLFSMMDNIGRM